MELVVVVSCCFFLVGLIKFLYVYMWRPLRIQRMLNSQGIKGPPYRFIHGNNKEAMKMKMEAMSKPMGLSHDIFPKVQPHLHAWINKYGKNFLYWNGVRAELVITEAELIKQVMKNSENSFPKRKPTVYGRKLLGNGLVLIEGEKWMKRRKLANYAFHGESLKNMTPAIIASVETMLEKWKGQVGEEIEVFGEFRLLTSEVISRTAFGSSYREGEKIFDMLNKLSVLVSRNVFKTNFPFINKFWETADLLESDKLAKGIRDCVMEIVKNRENRVVSGDEGFGNDFLGLLVTAYHGSDNKNRLSMEDLIDECKTFYFAGQETVNSLLAWTVFLLAIYGDWQEKARKKVIDIFGDQNPHSEGIAKLKTITMIINETLRLYGQPNGLGRRVERQGQWGKLVLPANIDLQIVSFASHHDPQLWGDDVHLFKPERFADGIAEATKYNATAFFPFGLGPRSCVGMTFATTETKIALSMILQRYTITLSPAYVHSPVARLTLKPKHGIQVILRSL
ncbi:PHYB ACTIVATION TAGGED SUPPRESSOR 1 [Hibiscus trionum]|uniref:PHYB ACTIVATION TAGGED SUPPRESSOR 1 n=1 Tax=Hibiscus trionum TaxID=183268 RepID=A0A9W7GRG0_HIBTR|nr:PHYB ACTIVATION TAGGED SUPPRESSOR 1 [Hibiscus trionum]